MLPWAQVVLSTFKSIKRPTLFFVLTL